MTGVHRPPAWSRRKVLAGLTAAAFGATAVPAATRPVGAAPDALVRGLRFPEGPIADADGSIVVSEIAAGRLTRIHPDGRRDTVAEPGGGPNGNAWGPDGSIYCCNNGGFEWSERDGLLIPGHRARDYVGGRVDRIDPRSGGVTTLYRQFDGAPLSAPNDLVFDAHGGFWFTDHGATTERGRDHGAVYYARADGTRIERVVHPLLGPNGIALSPDGSRLYVALTYERQILEFTVDEPGRLSPLGPLPGRPLASFGGRDYLDSMRVEADGTLCVGVLVASGIRRLRADGRPLELVAVPDLIPASLCFGGADLRTAWLLGSTVGAVYRRRWPAAGLRLVNQPR